MTDIDYPNISSAIVEALMRRPDWWTKTESHEPYFPTLPGVRYDRSQHRLLAQVNRSRGGKQVRIYVGGLPPTPENERILHERWKAARDAHDEENDR